MTFQAWLADLFQKDESEVEPLLRDKTAFQFLIVWSLFEAKCFEGFMKIRSLERFAADVIADGYEVDQISRVVANFHSRYQDEQKFFNLMHRQSLPRMERLLKLGLDDISAEDKVFFLAVVIYRYRNNMFHGNKGVRSWLRFRDQISDCIQGMQSFISHFESVSPSLPERRAA